MVFLQKIIYPKIKNGKYVINLNEYKSIATHWIALYVMVKILTIGKNSSNRRGKNSYLLRNLVNFNEIFKKNITYDGIKSA